MRRFDPDIAARFREVAPTYTVIWIFVGILGAIAFDGLFCILALWGLTSLRLGDLAADGYLTESHRSRRERNATGIVKHVWDATNFAIYSTVFALLTNFLLDTFSIDQQVAGLVVVFLSLALLLYLVASKLGGRS